MSNGKRLIIMRGLHGSGKTLLAVKLEQALNGKLASIDHYFERTGEYRFNSYRLPKAYAFCEGQVDAWMHDGIETIIVDGTHPRKNHLEPYIDLAKMWDYDVRIAYPPGEDIWDVDVNYARCTHHILRWTIEEMSRIFEKDVDIPILEPEFLAKAA